MDRNPEAEAIWKAFIGTVDLPFKYSRVAYKAYCGPIQAVAAATFVHGDHPDFRGEEFARVMLTDRFLRLNDDERVLTLQHECLHLVGFTEHLRVMDRTKWTLFRLHAGAPAYRLATNLADQLFENDAELMFGSEWPQRLPARVSYQVAQKLSHLGDRPWMGQPEAMRPFELVGHRLRLELLLRLAEDLPLRQRLTDGIRFIEQELASSLDKAPGARADVEALAAILSPARQDLGSLSVWGSDAYRQALEVVLRAAAAVATPH